MTVVRITIKKTLNPDLYSPKLTAKSAFSSDYLIQTDSSFPSPQLKAYAQGIAQAESRLYLSCVRFYEAMIKLATPGASGEELRGKFWNVDIDNVCGQVVMGEEDVLAFPPIAAIFARNVRWGNGGRLLLPHILTATEWSLYHHKQVVPLRFQNHNSNGLTPSSLFSYELIEAIRGSNGAYIRLNGASETQQSLRRVDDFVWMGFQIGLAKPKKRKAKKVAQSRSILGDDGAETGSTPLKKGTKSKVPIAGVVYMLQGGQWFKIGRSINPDKRLTQIKLQIPFPVEVVHIIRAADPLEVESHWHRRFASLRRNGEWFLLTDAEVNDFKSVSEM